MNYRPLYTTNQTLFATSSNIASGNDFRQAVALVLGVVVAGFALSTSKFGKEILLFVYHSVNRLFGGAPRTVGLPGPLGFPLVGNLYQVSRSWRLGAVEELNYR